MNLVLKYTSMILARTISIKTFGLSTLPKIFTLYQKRIKDSKFWRPEFTPHLKKAKIMC